MTRMVSCWGGGVGVSHAGWGMGSREAGRGGTHFADHA